MNVMNMRVATKLWLTLLGLLLVLSISNLWGQGATIDALEKSRTDVQRIENKITAAEQMQGAGLRLVDVGVSLIAVSNEENRRHLSAMFNERAQLLKQAMETLQSQLVTQDDHRAFAAIADASESTRLLREQGLKGFAADDHQGRREFAYGAYAAGGVKYEAAIASFIQLQHQQLQAWMDVANATRDRVRNTAWAITVVLLVLGVLLARWLVRTITAPLQEAINVSEAIGAGDLTVRVNTMRHDEFGELMQALSAMAGQLRQVVTQVRGGVTEVSLAANEIANGTHDLSARTEQTAANLEQTAASIEELTATVHQSAETSQQANELARGAVQAAQRGGDIVEQVVGSMAQINASSRKISDIIGVIDGIAFQTNILALNAAVEAARAGEQGRGFAVVAGEVRSLAQRSAEAAKEIKHLITASVSNVDAGSLQVAQAGESMQEIVASVRRVTDLIAEISAASAEQRDGFAQVNQAIANLDQMTQQNAALVEESSAASTAMNEQAQRLQEAVSVFRVGDQTAAVAAKPVVAKTAVTAPKKPAAAPVVASAKPVVNTALSSKVAAAQSAPASKLDNLDDWETF